MQGTPEWLAEHYSQALLRSDKAFMQTYVATGKQIESAYRNPYTAAMHIIKLCPQSSNNPQKIRRFLVLFGGKLSGAVYGIDTELVAEDKGWRVKNAALAVSNTGKQLNYQRNCNLDMTPETRSFSADLPSAISTPDIAAGPEGQ